MPSPSAHSLLPLVQKQDDYYAKMKAFLSDHSNTYLAEHYDSSEQELIQDIEGSLLRRSYAFDDSPHGYSKRISNSQQQRSYKEAFSKKPQPLQEYAEADINEHELLLSIAQCIYDSNQLFDQFVNDNSPMGFLISLRTSYERLSQYCKLIGERDMVAIVCENISSINHQIELGSTADSNPQTDNMPTNGIRTLLGMEKPIHESYDAFISYSHTEEDIASKIYHFLRNSLQEPFFDRTSLPELSDSDYEDAIMEAIDWSRHLILIVSDLATLNSRWVRLEVKTFLHEVREGRKSDGNVLLVVSNAVWDEITRSNKRCLPIILRACEILKLDSYRSTILSYLR